MTNPFINQAKEKLGSKIQEVSTAQSIPKNGKININLIDVKEQVRKDFNDEHNTIDELSEDIKLRGILQPILVRPIGSRYELIAGERRLRAAKKIGLENIPANVIAMSDEEAEDAQFAENIHRKNLTILEEATKVQKDLDALNGDVEALLKKYNKSKSWLSKLTSILKLPKETQRLIDEDISADAEVINSVKQIEKVDPFKAAEVVDTLKNKRKDGQGSAREIVKSVKDEVKPSKKVAAKKAEEKKLNTTFKEESFSLPTMEVDNNSPFNELSSTKEKVKKEENTDSIFEFDKKSEEKPSFIPSVKSNSIPAWATKLLNDEALDDEEQKLVNNTKKEIEKYFEQGKITDLWVQGVLRGLDEFYFSKSFTGKLNLLAYSAGFNKESSFELKELIEQIKI